MTLTVDRMHTRYVGAAARHAGQLDRVVEAELDTALSAVPLPAGHVCLRRVTAPVRLAGTAGVARSWAEQVAAAIAAAATDAVVYPRTVDALVDLLVSAGRGDLARAWAWRQLGVAGADPGRPDAAVAALAARPESAPAALRAAAGRGPVPLTAAGWVAVARRVGELAGPVSPATGGPPPAGVAAAVLSSPVGRRLPRAVADLPAADRREVARLLLLCAAPALARSATAVAAVGERLGGPPAAVPPASGGLSEPAAAAATATAPAATGEPGQRAAAAEAAADPAGTVGTVPAGRSARSGLPAARDPAARASALDGDRPAERGSGGRIGGPPAEVVSPAGGLLLLIAATGVPDLRAAVPPPLPGPGPLADRPLTTVVARLAARLGEVGPDDPAVHVLAGQPPEPPPRPAPAEESALDDLAGEVRGWLRTLLRLEPADDLRWLWRRPARIAAEPGWVEATFSLDDVDTRVRAAGLDLDPGFVWWLGAVVRYRYA